MKEIELHEFYRQHLYSFTLATPQGDHQVEVIVSYLDDEVSCEGKQGEASTVKVSFNYHGEEYWGYGSDYLWIDAFADLQMQLPENVFLKCCLTCRHGNLCPVGNACNEVFCTKDVEINQKSDLYLYTEDNCEREKRSRQYCYLCKSYQPQSDNHYTYNDYWYQLHCK